METARLLAALSILLLRRLLRLAANPRIYYLFEVGKHIVCIDIPPSGVSHNKQLVGGTAPEPPKIAELFRNSQRGYPLYNPH